MIEIGPDGIVAAAGRLGLTASEARLLAPDHPFLRIGQWRAFGIERDGVVAARLVASADPRQRDSRGPVGCIGFVRLATAPSTGHADPDRAVLAAGTDWLWSRGITTIRCPVQLSTWYGHRAMTSGFPDASPDASPDGGTAVPAFPLEPAPERRLPGLLEAGGFRPAHRAVSCLVDASAVVDGTAAAVIRARRSGIRDRPIRVTDLDRELRLLHRLAEAIFDGTWGLSHITFDEFASIYRPLDGQVDPELIRILEAADGTPIGFALGLRIGPDRSPSAPPGAFVLKSIGVTADARRRVPGIGAALIGMVHRVARDGGSSAGIHALMADGSAGHRLSLRWGGEFRSYATFERTAR